MPARNETSEIEVVNPNSEIPHEPLDLSYSSGGFLPDIGIYRCGGTFCHRPAHSHWWFFGIMLVGAVVVTLLPWHTKAALGDLKYWVAGMFLMAGICDIVFLLIRNAYGQQVTVDPKNETLSITSPTFSANICWRQILALQVCRQKVPGNSETNGYQLNLVWLDADGTVKRHCLLKHTIRRFVSRLGHRYVSLFGFTLIDHTRPSRSDGAAIRDGRNLPAGEE